MALINDFFSWLIDESQVVWVLFRVFSVLAVILTTVHYTRTYLKTMITTEPIKVQEFLKPLFITAVIVLWPWLYEILDSIFEVLRIGTEEYMASNVVARYNYDVAEVLKKLNESPSMTLLNLNINAVLIEVMKYVLQIGNYIVDSGVAIYLGVNDLILGLLVPIAIVLTLFKETSGAFIAWLKLFIKFRLYMIADLAITHFCTMFLFFMISKMPATLGTSILLVPSQWILIMIQYLVMKILLIIVAFNLLNKLIESGDLGVGAASSAMTKSAKQAVTMIFTKGAYKGV